MPKPPLLMTRHFPPAVEARAARDYATVPNAADTPMSGAEIARAAAQAEVAGVLCAAGDAMTAEAIAALPDSVRIIATFSAGTDHIDLKAAAARGIPVTNTPDVLSVATAEIAMLLILATARRAGEGERFLRARQWTGWAPTQLMGVTLAGKKLGILGMGRIGQELARMARGFGMEIHYRNRHPLPDAEAGGARYHDSDEGFLGAIDVLSMHIPGGAATRHWLDARRLALLRPGSIVVNTGRGSTVDDAALCAALGSGHLRAAGLDVFDGEPRLFGGYHTTQNLVLLPHLGSATVETRDAMGHLALDNLDAVLLRGESPPNRVG